MYRRTVFVALLSFLLLTPFSAFAQEFEFFPGATYDPSVPTLEKVTGHKNGERITMHSEATHYLRVLAEASPKIQLVRFGETWEGRALHYLIVTSETNQARIEEIKAGMQRLADPRTLSDAEATQLIDSLPSIVWLSYGVHGNEISSTDAGLMAAYHLAASQNDAIDCHHRPDAKPGRARPLHQLLSPDARPRAGCRPAGGRAQRALAFGADEPLPV
jgi:hypothetical protein